MNDLFETILGQTPLTQDDIAGLIPGHIQLRSELNEWEQNNTYSPIEIAVRLHHRLVVIHPFPNGNGRHARLVADIYLHQRQLPSLTWGTGQLQAASVLRTQYIKALQETDNGNLEDLVAFAKS